MRPGHFWACQLGDADTLRPPAERTGKCSPVIHKFTRKNEWYELKSADGTIIGKYRGDDGDYLLLVRRYYHRVATDAAGLIFKRCQQGLLHFAQPDFCLCFSLPNHHHDCSFAGRRQRRVRSS